jgi:nucleoside-diphosphate-sugar epimerase
MLDKNELILVTGAGGFIGGHLVADLLDQGYERVRAVDIKPFEHWYQVLPRAENLQRDLAEKAACYEASESAGYVFNLAADMGGMGFIETHKADCMISVLINTHMLMAARDCGVSSIRPRPASMPPTSRPPPR